jgi:hypothetical protein
MSKSAREFPRLPLRVAPLKPPAIARGRPSDVTKQLHATSHRDRGARGFGVSLRAVRRCWYWSSALRATMQTICHARGAAGAGRNRRMRRGVGMRPSAERPRNCFISIFSPFDGGAPGCGELDSTPGGNPPIRGRRCHALRETHDFTIQVCASGAFLLRADSNQLKHSGAPCFAAGGPWIYLLCSRQSVTSPVDRQQMSVFHLFHHHVTVRLGCYRQLLEDVRQQASVLRHAGETRLDQVVVAA